MWHSHIFLTSVFLNVRSLTPWIYLYSPRWVTLGSCFNFPQTEHTTGNRKDRKTKEKTISPPTQQDSQEKSGIQIHMAKAQSQDYVWEHTKYSTALRKQCQNCSKNWFSPFFSLVGVWKGHFCSRCLLRLHNSSCPWSLCGHSWEEAEFSPVPG